MMWTKSSQYWTVLAFLVLLFCFSCENNIEGCLDPVATNFSADADEDCCCTYPTFSLNLFHFYDTINFTLDRSFVDAAGDPFIVSEMIFFLHDFVLEDSLGNQFSITDSLSFTTTDGTSYVTADDHILVDLPDNAFGLGSSLARGEFQTLYFNFGLDLPSNEVDITSIDATNVLTNQEDSMYIASAEEHVLIRMKVLRDSSGIINEIFEWTGSENTVRVAVPISLEVTPNTNFTLSLDFDMKVLLEGVAFQNDTDAEILTKIVQNVTTAFKER